MGIAIAVLVVVVVAAAVAVVLVRRSKRPSPAPVKPAIAEAPPMIDLETALDQVTDRSGRNMREKIESTTAIDDLRVPDDTGPVLRRALDHVEHVEPPVTPSTDAATPPSPSVDPPV